MKLPKLKCDKCGTKKKGSMKDGLKFLSDSKDIKCGQEGCEGILWLDDDKEKWEKMRQKYSTKEGKKVLQKHMEKEGLVEISWDNEEKNGDATVTWES